MRRVVLGPTIPTALLLGFLAWGCKPSYSGELVAGDRLVKTDPTGAAQHYALAVSMGAVVQGNIGLAHIAETRRDWPKTVEHYALAHKGAPKDVNIRFGLVRAHVLAGERERALAELRAIAEENPAEPRAALLLGALAATPDEAQVALTALDRLDKQPKGAAPRSLEQAIVRREVLRLLGKRQEADAPIRPEESKLGSGDDTAITLAGHYAGTGRPAAALRLLRGATEQNPATSAAWLPLLRQEMAARNYTEARGVLRQMPAKLRETAEVQELEARLHLATDDEAGAIRAARRAVDLTGTAGSDEKAKQAKAERLALLGQVLAQAKRDQEATEAFGQSLKLAPKLHVARLALAAIDLRQQRFEPAAQAAREVIAAQPQFDKAHELLIAVLMAANKKDEARAAAEAYVVAMPKNAEAVAMRGKVLLELGDVRSARADLLRALELLPTLLPALDLLLEAEHKRAGYDAAASLGATVAQKAGRASAYVHLAAFHEKNGKSDAATKCLRQAVEVGASDVGAWRKLAAHLAAHGKRDEAMAALERVVALAPRREDSYPELAKLQTQAGQTEAARATYRKWLGINPRAVGALNNLAMLYAEASSLADLDQGVAMAERARVEAPTAAAVNDTLGWLLVRRGNKADLRRAIMLLESAVAVESAPEIYYHLGAAQAAAGSREAAAAALRKATQPGAKYPGLAEAQRLLKQLAP